MTEEMEKQSPEICQVHGGRFRSGDTMLVCMVLASLSLVVWHVWAFGTSGGGTESGPFPQLLWRELIDLLFSRRGILAELWEVFPYFLAGILIAGYLRTFKVAVKLQAKLRKYGVMSVVLASLVGIISPLCACGTVTTAISLLYAGIPLAPVMALMVTSPLMSPTTYLLTLNDLGPEWTVIRTVSAFSMGVFAGLVTHLLGKRNGFRKADIFVEGAIIRGDFHDDDYPDERLRCNCRRQFGNRVAVRTGNRFLVFLAKSAEMLWVVGKYVIVGVFIGEIAERYMPSEWIYRFFGSKEPLGIVWVTLASVPIFLHQISASSILFHIKGTLGGTLDSGAALAFMIGGPVTAVPTMVLFWTFFKKRVFFLYLFVCLSGTLLIAYAFQGFMFVPGTDVGNSLLRGVSSLTGGTSRIVSKDGANVRMVMDPEGKGIIATFTNDLDGLGGIVFDGSRSRFTDGSMGRCDNGRYIVNIASWLEQNSTSTAAKNILVCDLSGDHARLSIHPGGALHAGLKEKGFTVRVADRDSATLLNPSQLDQSGQLWLFFGPEGANRLSDRELKLIEERNAKGMGMLIVPAGSGGGGSEADRLSSRYGVRFTGTVVNGDEMPVSRASRLIDPTAEWLGKVLSKVKRHDA